MKPLEFFTTAIESGTAHPDIKRTQEVADFAYATCTGDKLDKYIESVRRRETDQQKAQRIRITKALASVSVEMVKKYYAKLRKTDGVKQENSWIPDNESAKSELTAVTGNFYGGQNVEEYVFDACEMSTFIDPNMFLAIEPYDVEDENNNVREVRTSPLLFESHEIRDYAYHNGQLQILLTEKVKGNLSTFRLYLAGAIWHFVEFKGKAESREGYNTISVTQGGTAITRNFQYKEYTNESKECPAIRLGAYMDGRTMGRTAVTPMEPVRPLMEQLINIGSLHDLTIFLHSFPRRRELVEACDSDECNGGELLDGTSCPKCYGTGDKSINSEQDNIKIRLPEGFRPEDIPDLAKLAHTESADVALLGWQQEKIDWLLKFILYATMTKDAVSMSEVVQTATEVRLNNQSSYDKIHPYAQLVSNVNKLINRVTVQYQGNETGFFSLHQFSDDYQFETEADLLGKLSQAQQTNVPYSYLKRLEAQLVRKQTRSVEEGRRLIAWQQWQPWPDLSDQMLIMVLLERESTDPERYLKENFVSIQQAVEQKTSGLFYMLDYDKQARLISEEVSAGIERTIFKAETNELDFN